MLRRSRISRVLHFASLSVFAALSCAALAGRLCFEPNLTAYRAAHVLAKAAMREARP